MTAHGGRFDPAMLDGLDEPVRRYFAHALAAGTPLTRGVRLRLSGQIRVGAWLRFDSVWEGDGRSFAWRATAGPGRLLAVEDRFADAAGSMDVRLRRPPVTLLHAANVDTTRSGAGRAALEALWTPGSLLPGGGVSWHAESDELIVATWDVPPERPELRIAIDLRGAVRAWHAQRWRDARTGYLPCGADVQAERSFGGLTIPSRLTVGWGYGTQRWAPFFRCEATALETLD